MSDFVPSNSLHAMMAQQDMIWQSLGFPRCPRFLSSTDGLVPESVADWEIVERMEHMTKIGLVDGQRRMPVTIIDARDGSIISTDGSGFGSHAGDVRTLTFEKGRGWISAPAHDDAPPDHA